MNRPSPNIKTGHPEQSAFFCSVLYKLTLLQNNETHTIDLGFSGGRLLERLIQEAGELIDRQTLIAHAWNDRVVGPGSLNQQIYTLRKILGDEKERQIIQTVARRGYRFNPEFLLAPQPPACTARVEPHEAVVPAGRQGKRRKWTLGMISATLLVGNFSTTLPTQLYASRQQVGENSVVYVEHQQPHLQKLIQHTRELSQRILALSDKPVELSIVGGENGYYHIYCAPQGRESHTLSVHNEKVQDISDSQLRRCME